MRKILYVLFWLILMTVLFFSVSNATFSWRYHG